MQGIDMNDFYMCINVNQVGMLCFYSLKIQKSEKD